MAKRSHAEHEASPPTAPRGARVAVLLHEGNDEFGHFAPYCNALAGAFGRRQIELTQHVIDSPDSVQLLTLAKDPRLLFFIGFNGWAANLAWQQHSSDGVEVTSFFTHFDKPLLDHFADPPFADEMQHARQFDMAERLVLYTDHTYLAWDGLYGPQRHSSYFIPQFVPEDHSTDLHVPFERRGIDFLLPVSLYDPDYYYRRMLEVVPERLAGQALFDEVVGTLLDQPRADALQWISHLWLQKGIPFSAQNAWQQSAISAAWHYVKNRRRQIILDSLHDRPVTILTKGIPYQARLHPKSQVLAPRSFAQLSDLMRETRVCICPTPHVRGFHERILLAMSRGAVALTSPNQVCEENFLDGQEIIFFQDHGSGLRSKVSECDADWSAAAELAARGQQTMQARFSVDFTVDHMLKIHHNFRRR
jgi:Glycosyl transferases group 1